MIASVKRELELLISRVQKEEARFRTFMLQRQLMRRQVVRNRTRVAEICKFSRAEEDLIQKIEDDLADA